MTIDDLVTWFAVKGAGVCVDRSPLDGFPGYVRHVSVMPDARVIVEFLWADTDEGGATYVASCESVLAAVDAVERFIGRGITEWKNLTALGWYPEVELPRKHDPAPFRQAVRDGQLALPKGLSFTLKEAFWREV
jgi:hypothetical protein